MCESQKGRDISITVKIKMEMMRMNDAIDCLMACSVSHLIHRRIVEAVIRMDIETCPN